MFNLGDKVISCEPLKGGSPSLRNRVRGKVVEVKIDSVIIQNPKVYLPGYGWFPNTDTNEVLEIFTSENSIELTHFEK